MKISLNREWKFFRGDLSPESPCDGWGGAKARAYFSGAAAADCNDSRWRSVDLPHDFVSEGDYTRKANGEKDMRDIPEMESIDSRHFAGGSLEGGVAWYRKAFTLPANTKRAYLFFGGVYRNSTVYLNEYFIGTHASGYTSFYYDITDFMNTENTLAVRVDSSGREGWWYEGGGIYRDVWIETVGDVHTVPYSLYAPYELDLKTRTAMISVEAEIANRRTTPIKVGVRAEILDAAGNAAACGETETCISPWDEESARIPIRLADAKLWDTKNPYLYTVRLSIVSGGEVIDVREVPLGIRQLRFDADKGFFLNGVHTVIKGFCCHHDHAGVGIGIPDEVWDYRIAKLKETGMNAYRCAHSQASEYLLSLCDREGILVMGETRRMSSAPEDLENLRTLVRVSRNHPSVFIWSVGNEEIFAADRPETERGIVTMRMEIRKLDATRPITAAIVCWNGEERFENARNYIHVTKNLDVMGFNYCKTAWDDYHDRCPKQPVIITEESTSGFTRGCHSTDESKGQYFIFDKDNISKCKNGWKAAREEDSLGESTWKYFSEREYLSGIFLWTGIDYRGEPTPLTYPAVYSQFGVLDYCGFEKDGFYYYKSQWTNEPVLHLFPHWNLREGEITDVYCYTNADEAELLVNGRSLGKKDVNPNGLICWEGVEYEPGELSARGFKNGSLFKTETVRTTGAAKSLNVRPYRTSVKPNGAVIIDVCAADENGETVPTADNFVTYKISGGTLLGTGNGNPGDHDSEKTPSRRLFAGRGQIIVRAGDEGTVTVTAESDTLKSAVCEIPIK